MPEVDRERLLTLLDLYGIQRAVGSVREGVSGAVALRRALSDSSGIAEVKRTLATYFHEQDHVLKVRSAFELLKRMTYVPVAADLVPAMTTYRGMVEKLRLDPEMHAVDELQAWHDCCTGRVELPAEELAEIERLFAPGTPARKLALPGADQPSLAEAAKQGMVRWRSFMVTQATPEQARMARVVLRSYQLLWTSINEEAS